MVCVLAIRYPQQGATCAYAPSSPSSSSWLSLNFCWTDSWRGGRNRTLMEAYFNSKIKTYSFIWFFVGSSFAETSSSVMVYMDTTAMTARTTSRPTTLTVTTTTARSTTTKLPVTTTSTAYWPRTTTTAVAPVQTLTEDLDAEDEDKEPSSSRLPTIRIEYCSPLVLMDVSWPRTKQGTVSKMACPPGTIGKVN